MSKGRDIVTKILSITKQIEIRKILSGAVATQVKETPKVIQKGTREIERLDVPTTSVKTNEVPMIRAYATPKEILKTVNHGPQGARGEKGEAGERGPAGSIDNFVMEDLTALFRSRLV